MSTRERRSRSPCLSAHLAPPHCPRHARTFQPIAAPEEDIQHNDLIPGT